MATLVTNRVIQDGTINYEDLAPAALRTLNPPGAVMSFAMSAAPDGWLPCNGAAINRTTYAPLFSAIRTTFGIGDGANTFNLPDLRGEFIRGWAENRAVDTGRAFGATQSQNWKSLYFTNTYNTYVHEGYWGKNIYPDWYSPGNEGMFTGYWFSAGTPPGPYYATATRFSWDDTEIRPRNIALLYCIKF
jgi:phage-related tail fiber protein